MHSFIEFSNTIIAQKRQAGHFATASAYQAAVSRLGEFAAGRRILLSDIDHAFIADFESWLHRKGTNINSSSCYIRTLRSIYNRAVCQSLVKDDKPFTSAYTGVADTPKRAIGIREMRRLRDLRIGDPAIAMARDYFLLSFYMRGISFVDLAMLKKKDLNDGVIRYFRSKTRQLIQVSVNKNIAGILSRYPASVDSPYLLPILHPSDSPEEEWRHYRSALRVYNRRLKRLAALAGLPGSITSYTPRHTWATIAQEKEVRLSVISQALGHNRESTTRIYLRQLAPSLIDEANDLVGSL